MNHKQYIGRNKYELDTPALVIDKKKLLYNLQLMQQMMIDKNLQLRPHAKTHKCSKIAKLQLEYGSIGICVAKISEALIMIKANITGILVTSPVITNNKIQILLEILSIDPNIIITVDNIDNIELLNKIMGDNAYKLNIILDIDAFGRTGANLDHVITLAQAIINCNNLIFCGLQCYAGDLQHILSLPIRTMKSNSLLMQVQSIIQKLKTVNIYPKIITGSGTGTFSTDAALNVFTEIQAGSYCVMDQEYNDIEYDYDKFLTAMTMLTTVISTNHTTHVTVDAGTKSMYMVDTKPQIINYNNLNYGWDFGDEHGKITSSDNKLPILGAILELRVAHCDPTINLFDYFYITEDDIVIDVWNIDLRGMNK